MNLEDEIRDGYKVYAKTKRVWQTEINILKCFDTVCKQHGLKYYADFGTLLGAIRHKGFIPWDDDIDVTMTRPDYQCLCEIGKDCFTEPFFFQNSYTDSAKVMNFSRIRDSRTAMIEDPVESCPEYNQGIFIDIWPLDIVPREAFPKSNQIVQIAVDLWESAADPKGLIKRMIFENYRPLMGVDGILDILEMPCEERLRVFESFLCENYNQSDAVNVFSCVYRYRPCEKRWYEHIIMLPFEDILVPAPCGYDELLKVYYGNYWEPVMDASDHHFLLVDPDRSYREF